jgi:hypothetical protein
MNRKSNPEGKPVPSADSAPVHPFLSPAAKAAPGQTRAEPFHYIPRLGQHLFTVNAGVPSGAARDDALCLLICARERLDEGVQEGMDANECHLVAFALGAAIALLTAEGGV